MKWRMKGAYDDTENLNLGLKVNIHVGKVIRRVRHHQSFIGNVSGGAFDPCIKPELDTSSFMYKPLRPSKETSHIFHQGDTNWNKTFNLTWKLIAQRPTKLFFQNEDTFPSKPHVVWEHSHRFSCGRI
jgi:hypothetical protein